MLLLYITGEIISESDDEEATLICFCYILQGR